MRPRSRARATHETTDAGLSVSSVSSRATSTRPSGRTCAFAVTSSSSSPGTGGFAPMIASTPSQLSAMPRSPGTPATSA